MTVRPDVVAVIPGTVGQSAPRTSDRRYRQKAWEKISGAGSGRVEEHPSLYQVDGEVGRWVFKTYDVKGEDHETRFGGIELFPPRHGRQWYQTCGFKEIALLCGAAQRSYRQTTQWIQP